MSSTRSTSCVHQAFEWQARRRPDAPAVSCAGTTWSYRQLNALANRFARVLLACGVGRGARIGLFAARSGERIAAMLAIAKTGAAYVPLEPDLPDERLRAIADGAGVTGVVCLPRLVWTGRQEIIGIDSDAPSTTALPDNDLDLPVSPDDVFYVPFTSGSSGQPKGVEVPHRSIAGFFQGADYAEWGVGETHMHFLSMAWDGHILEVYPSLLRGGHVLVYPDSAFDPVEIARFAARNAVTGMMLPTQAFNTVVDLAPESLRGLRWLMVGGEKASAHHVAAALASLPGVRIANLYGPVECTVLATAHILRPQPDPAAVPIGREVGDRRVYVLDDTQRPVADGEVGELCIGGPGVAHGYLGDPRLTARMFVPDQFSGVPGARLYRTGDLGHRGAGGVYDYAGRRDGQVKVRGYRIETSEIEAILRGHPGIADAAVVADAAQPSGPRLVAFVVPVRGAPIADLARRLNDDLARRLPSAAVPAAVRLLERLPMVLNGKLDRRALIEVAALVVATTPTAHYEPPATATERTLSALWREQLGVERVGRDDDFFALGGHSLAGTRMIARVRLRYDADLTVRQLYDAPTLALFAGVVDRRSGSGGRMPGIQRIPRLATVRDTANPNLAVPRDSNVEA